MSVSAICHCNHCQNGELLYVFRRTGINKMPHNWCMTGAPKFDAAGVVDAQPHLIY